MVNTRDAKGEPSTAQILVVDRDPVVKRRALAYLRERGYRVEWVDDAEKAFNRLDSRLFDVLITELAIGRVDGMRVMAVARERNPDICVVFVTEAPDIERATQAMREGAYDFQMKPLNLAKLDAVIQRGLAHQQLVVEQVELKRRLDERFGLGSLVGQSRQMIQVYSAVRQAGPTEAPVAIMGEPGTGKQLIAQALHNSSPRRNEAFVRFDCSGMPTAMVDSEVFGRARRGREPHVGRCELADGGTLYLEKLADFPASLHGKLASLITRGRVEREGDRKRLKVDVRLVVSLDERPEAGVFEEPLASLLSGVIIEAPALRDRREDIPLLATRMLRRAAEEHGRPVEGFTRGALDLFMRYPWPENVRELQNLIEGMVVAGQGGAPLGTQDLPKHLLQGAVPDAAELRIPPDATMAEAERAIIIAALERHSYNKEETAKALGIGLRTLYRRLHDYGMA